MQLGSAIGQRAAVEQPIIESIAHFIYIYFTYIPGDVTKTKADRL